MKIEKNTGIYTLGDSITVGQSATTGNSYASKLVAYIGGSLNNQGVSGSGTCEAARRGVTISKTRNYLMTVMSGLNDVRRTGLNSITKIKTNLRAIIHAGLSGNCVSAGHLTRTGSWTVLSSLLGGRGRSLPAGGAISTTDSSATLSWSFTGTNLIVGSIASANNSFDDLEIIVDGVSHYLQVSNITDENYSYPSLLIKDLEDTTHNVVIKSKNGTQIAVDYVGILAENPTPILIAYIPYLTSLTYAGNTITLADIDAVNAEIESIVCEYDNVGLVRTNDFYNLSTGISSDGIHPNNVGHNQIYEAFISEITLTQDIIIPSWANSVIINDEPYTLPITIKAIS